MCINSFTTYLELRDSFLNRCESEKLNFYDLLLKEEAKVRGPGGPHHSYKQSRCSVSNRTRRLRLDLNRKNRDDPSSDPSSDPNFYDLLLNIFIYLKKW